MAKKNSIGVEKHPGANMPSSVAPSGPRPLDDFDHQQNAETLMKGQEIMQDPAKMKGALIHLKKKAKAIKSVQDIKDFHQQKYGPGGDPDMEVGE
jgi:hypothetical protein